MRNKNFPFVSIYGLEKVKEAILLILINPRVGGLLVSGSKGSGKSILMRAMKELVDTPQVEVPVSVTEDRLFGSIDMEKAFSDGKKVLRPGLIHVVDHGILYIDDVNLFPSDLLSTILEIKDQELYLLERDGISVKNEVSFQIMAVMNPEEVTLKRGQLDHFGIFVQIEDAHDVNSRVEIIKRNIMFEKNGVEFISKFENETKKLKERIRTAKEHLSHMVVSDAMIQLAAVYSLKAHVSGHRADIYLIETAKSEAAWNGRDYVLPCDLERAAEFVLPHRMRKKSELEKNRNRDEEQKTQRENYFNDHKNNANKFENNFNDDSCGELDEKDEKDEKEDKEDKETTISPGDKDVKTKKELPRNPIRNDKIDTLDESIKLPPIWIDLGKSRKIKHGSGKRSLTRTSMKQGRYVRSRIPTDETMDIAFDATLRAAAPYQKLRKKGDRMVVIHSEDIRSKIREKRVGNILLLVVDASASMGVAERMKTVKGVVFKILLDAYQKRDRVGLIAFRKKEAEILLPVTRSIDFAKQKLEKMPVGGKTPLAKGLMKVESMLDRLYRQDSTQEPVVILVTDGRATEALENGGNPVGDAIIEAERIGKRHLPIAVIDTENGFIKLGLAKEIAKKMGASYFSIDKLTEENLIRIWKSTLIYRE